MKWAGRVKIISTVVLVLCLSLPISSCNKYVDANGKEIVKYDPALYPHAKRITTYNYPLEHFDPRDISTWLLLLAFLWPLPFVWYRYRGRKKRAQKILWGIEPLCAAGSAYFIWFDAALLATPFVGAYVALSANSIYIMAWLSETGAMLVRKRQCQ